MHYCTCAWVRRQPTSLASARFVVSWFDVGAVHYCTCAEGGAPAYLPSLQAKKHAGRVGQSVRCGYCAACPGPVTVPVSSVARLVPGSASVSVHVGCYVVCVRGLSLCRHNRVLLMER